MKNINIYTGIRSKIYLDDEHSDQEIELVHLLRVARLYIAQNEPKIDRFRIPYISCLKKQ